MDEIPPRDHWEFAQSHVCGCSLCTRWRRWLGVRHKAEAASRGHRPGCRCKLCLLLLSSRQATLAAELRLDVWIELGWYSDIEDWGDWAPRAWELINNPPRKDTQTPDRWWTTDGQYKTMDFWLDKFRDLGATEQPLVDPETYKAHDPGYSIGHSSLLAFCGTDNRK